MFCLGFTELRKMGFVFGSNKYKYGKFLGFEIGESRSGSRSFRKFGFSDYRVIAIQICKGSRSISEIAITIYKGS